MPEQLQWTEAEVRSVPQAIKSIATAGGGLPHTADWSEQPTERSSCHPKVSPCISLLLMQG
ncbi:hypothetical protein [Synechococcus sp. UW179A]|uniref:hypothetical protein n=1 Tax=Synechococcus sp. UW179A TaxID=2575510 RepID=UPI0010BECD41|nr:hypothetical protein [Synechococcus sp. UW179A]